MRPSLLASLAPAAARNLARGRRRVALFELGPAYGASAPERQSRRFASLRAIAEGHRPIAASDVLTGIRRELAKEGKAA